jgi:hypothetical protein
MLCTGGPVSCPVPGPVPGTLLLQAGGLHSELPANLLCTRPGPVRSGGLCSRLRSGLCGALRPGLCSDVRRSVRPGESVL